jgi:hypothetical protein
LHQPRLAPDQIPTLVGGISPIISKRHQGSYLIDLNMHM